MDRPQDDHRVISVPAVGASITVNVGDNRQLVMQHYFAGDCPDDVANETLDRMFRLADRQKARYDLEKLEEEFKKVGETLGNLITVMPHAERNHRVEVAKLTVAAEEALKVQKEIKDEGYNAFVADGKRGTFNLQGHAKTRFDRAGDEIRRIEDQIRQKDADRFQHLQELHKSIAHYQADLRMRRERMNRMRALFGAEPVVDFLTEESYVPEALTEG